MKGQHLQLILMLLFTSRFRVCRAFAFSLRPIATHHSPTSVYSLPENSYKPFSLDDDKVLYENRRLSSKELSELLGRGERSVEKRLEHLKDVNTNGYRRLFCSSARGDGDDDDDDEVARTTTKLTKCSDVLSRIKFDYGLDSSMFGVDVYDRVEGVMERVAYDKENISVSGKERQFVFAIPEHRITAVYYRERLVWGRKERVDLISSIYDVIGTYEEWEEERRRKMLELQSGVDEASFIVGLEAGKDLWESWAGGITELASTMAEKGDTFRKAELEKFVDDLLEIVSFPKSMANYLSSVAKLTDVEGGGGKGGAYLKIAMEVRRRVASEDNLPSMQQAGTIKQVELDEKDIEESFVRGGGAWGQKVNKTASKVVLLHIPTGVRVATQKTRSLEQNRKIARKLLREKVDEFLEGGEARSAVKAEVKRSKKAKNKARSAKRRRKKIEGDEEE